MLKFIKESKENFHENNFEKKKQKNKIEFKTYINLHNQVCVSMKG